MQKKIILFLLITLISTITFAHITPETTPSVTMYGGETKEYQFTIYNDFSYDINVNLELDAYNETGNFEGMTYTLSNQDFTIKSYENKQITVKLKSANNIRPEEYGFSLTANYTLSDHRTVITRTRTGSTKTLYVDKNVNVIVEKPVEVIKEITKDNNIIITKDKNIYVPIQTDSNKINEDNKPNDSTIFVIIALMLIGVPLGVLAVLIIGKNYSGGN